MTSLVARRRLRALASKERREDLLALTPLFESGQVTPVIDRTYPLVEVAAAIRHLETGDVRGKLVITV